jgi:hypothetical protein
MSDIELIDNDGSREIRLSITSENIQLPSSELEGGEDE